jgi:hypothetical protein
MINFLSHWDQKRKEKLDSMRVEEEAKARMEQDSMFKPQILSRAENEPIRTLEIFIRDQLVHMERKKKKVKNLAQSILDDEA